MIRIVYAGAERVFQALPITIGRDDDNDLPLDDAKLSRQHCRICRTPEGIAVEDLSSSNGTFVNGAATARHVLAAGDSILIGVTTLTVEWDAVSAPPPKRRRPRDREELEHENERLTGLLELARAVASTRDEESLLRRILDAAITWTNADRGYLFLVTLHGLDFRTARDARGGDLDRPQEKISGSIASEAIESGKAVLTEDAGGDARFTGGRSVAFLNLRSVLCVPLKVLDGPIGAIYLESSLTGQFKRTDSQFVAAFGDIVALAIASARHKDQLAEREEQLRLARARVGRLNARLRSLLGGGEATSENQTEAPVSARTAQPLMGESPAIRRVLARIDRVANSDVPVLITGESGTGKELVARAIHARSPRHTHPFVCVNCSAIPPELIEAELFGREVGAYTGADTASPGLFERADKGTLFLDEIADMPAETQGKLLRVLEQGEFRRLGGTETRHADVRIVSATHGALYDMARSGTFREDLYYRLKGVDCPLPPLRERVEDIPALFDHFMDEFCAESDCERPAVDPEVVDRLQAYPWPGNVRELRNEVQRLLTLQRGRIGSDLLSLAVFSGDPEATPPVHLPEGGIKQLVVQLERRVLVDTMRRTTGNKTRAAALLGLSRLGLRKKLDRYGLSDVV